jgi:hypothetical protein
LRAEVDLLITVGMRVSVPTLERWLAEIEEVIETAKGV